VAEADAHYRHRGTRAIQRMVEYAPATGGLSLWVRHHDNAEPDAPPVTTNGLTICYGPAFDALPIAEQVGLVAHEVLHIALRHPQRFLDLQARLGEADLQLFNVCADAIVNSTLDHLEWLKLPAFAVRLDRLLERTLNIQQPVERSLLEWDVERLYIAIDDREESPRRDGKRAARARELGRGEATDLRPDAETRGPKEKEAEEAREWSERLIRAHAGDGLHSMLRALIADVPRSRTPWEQVLRARLARGLALRPELSWSRPSRSYIANQGRGGPNRRLPWEPGFTGTKRVPKLALIVDVSGSIEDDLMVRFAREIESITRRLESGLLLVVGDDAVRRVEQFPPGRSDLRDIRFEGGGGTDFSPMLEEANRHDPDIGLVLTDLEGPAHFRPRWPVIWAVPPAHANAVAPFGRKLVLE
jgi:predicted metal-dependent peptidase